MKVGFVEALRVDAEVGRTGAHDGAGRLDAFLHHVAETARTLHAPLAGEDLSFDNEHFTTHGRPGQAVDDAHARLLAGKADRVLGGPKIGAEAFGLDHHLFRHAAALLVGGEHNLAEDLADETLKSAHARLAGPVADDVDDGLSGEVDLFSLEPRGAKLLGNQVVLGDVDLLLLGIARKRNHLHAVQQGRRNVVAVRGRHKHHVGEIHRNLHVVVGKRVVLFGIKHLEHGRSGIPAMIRAHLVDFVKQEERVAHAGTNHALDDLTWHRAHVGATVAANLAFVMHAAQSHAHILAARGSGDGLAERGLADAGRTHEAENRRLHLAHALLNGEILENPLLHLFETGVVLVKNAGGGLKVARNAGLLRPRIVRERFDVAAHDDGLGAHRRHLAQAAKLVAHGLLGVLGHLRRGDAGFKIGVFFISALIRVAELLADGLELLVEIVVALVLVHLALDAAVDANIELLKINLSQQEVDPVTEARRKVGLGKHLHLGGSKAGHLATDKVKQTLGISLRVETARRLALSGAEGAVFLPLTHQLAAQRLKRALWGVDGMEAGAASHKRAVTLEERVDAIAGEALDEHLRGAVSQAEELHHACERADPVAVVLLGRIGVGLLLRDHENVLIVGLKGLPSGVDGSLARHEDGHQRRGEDHHVPHCDSRHFNLFGVNHFPVGHVVQISSPSECSVRS